MCRIAVLALLGFVTMAMAPAPRIADFGWLSGAWVSETKDGWTEELWTSPRGGMLLGTNRSGKGAKATGYEYMRIEADANGRISFWGSPGGKPAVPFALVSSGPREAVFENPKHDYPTRIVYRRQGRVLSATVSGPGGANPLSWKFVRR